MLVGNNNQISLSLFSPAQSIASVLALNFPEAGPKETHGVNVRSRGSTHHHARGQCHRPGHPQVGKRSKRP